MKKVLSFLIVLCMVTSVMGVIPIAADELTAEGVCGDNLTWTLDGDGTLVISGEGKMDSWNAFSHPWYDYRERIKKIVINEGVTNIGDHAFFWCSSLESIEIPKSVSRIEVEAFYNCPNLTSVYITDLAAWCNIELVHVASTPLYYGGKLYVNGELAREIVIPSEVNEIKDYAFYGCSSLKSVQIPSRVMSIGKYAFPSGENFAVIGYANSEAEKFAAENKNTFESLGEMPVEIIAEGKCGDNLAWTIDNYMVLTISGTGKMDKMHSGLQPWADYIGRIKKVVIEDGVTSIGSWAFYICENLVSVEIPEDLTRIEKHAFDGCINLTSVKIPYRAIEIGRGAFPSGENMTIIGYTYSAAEAFATENGNTFESLGEMPVETIAEGECGDGLSWTLNTYMVLTIIGEGEVIVESTNPRSWYDYKRNIKEVVIDAGVTGIGKNAFYNCGNLTDVYYAGSEEEWQNVLVNPGNERLTNAEIHYESVTTGAVIKDVDAAVGKNGTITVTVTLEENASDGTVCCVLMEDNTVVSSKVADAKRIVTITFDEGTTGSLVKVFRWDRVESMRPLCAAKTITVE